MMTVAMVMVLAASLDEGFDRLYQLRFGDARVVFAQYRKQHPESPMGPAGEAASYLFEEFERHGVLTTEFFLDDDTLLGGIKGKPDATRMASFHEAIRRTRGLAGARLAKNPKDAEALLAMTLAAGMESDAAGVIEKRQLEALRRMREADDLAKRLLAVAPGQGDAYMALGAASYIVGSMPAYKRVVLWLGGIRGDRARGMAELEIASKQGRYLRVYAKIALGLACLREGQGERALRLLNELLREYPQNPILLREKPKFESAARRD